MVLLFFVAGTRFNREERRTGMTLESNAKTLCLKTFSILLLC